MMAKVVTIKNDEIPFLRDSIMMYAMRGYNVSSRTISKGPEKCQVEIVCGDWIFEKIRKEFNTRLWIYH